MKQHPPHRLSVAPMMDWTDRHCRVLHRTLTGRAMLYTEMLTTGAVLHGDRARLLAFDAAEHPVALQLGGSEPDDLAAAARLGAAEGYDEINLNVGCPSDRVQSGRFGACLMKEPALVAECMAAIGGAVKVPATVKCRIGVDDQEPADSLFRLVDLCAEAGVRHFVVHARKAWLKGLSPKENRDIPPLDYPLVWRLKAERPELRIVINGGIASLDEAEAHLRHVDGVMLGRAAYHTPAILGEVDARLFGEGQAVSPAEAVARYRPYVERELAAGTHLAAMTRHMLGLFHGVPGARAWRRILTVEGVKPGAGIEVIDRALAAVSGLQDERAARRLEAGEAA
ncbi:tRNA dihydrouridine(20/20a) synthase DusA [Phenylobacterium soli]|uniref:tRNA-dihydrouridine(20/20a) synthase n=1 Tax=Phenylobacterium soli TaxID=2170551 RepID=A0A328ANY5_9CAUL|nr:tRNA dihydrouridine(20/20a) synthase DusA [Phenylobacterium soli]RAK56075.1 tRNA dihydrouridine(20/20a) synthase DusA [Phenylobacterium soli]